MVFICTVTSTFPLCIPISSHRGEVGVGAFAFVRLLGWVGSIATSRTSTQLTLCVLDNVGQLAVQLLGEFHTLRDNRVKDLGHSSHVIPLIDAIQCSLVRA